MIAAPDRDPLQLQSFLPFGPTEAHDDREEAEAAREQDHRAQDRLHSVEHLRQGSIPRGFVYSGKSWKGPGPKRAFAIHTPMHT